MGSPHINVSLGIIFISYRFTQKTKRYQMNQQDIKNLEKELWDAADELRGNSKLTAGEYKDPLLGLVLLRFAQNRYEDAKIVVEENLPINPRTGQKREATKDDFAAAGAIMLPEKAKYDFLADLPESEDIAEAINNAMKLIETEYPDLAGILPKSYQEFDDKLLQDLVRVFNKDAVRNARGDVFGRIYEFFLMKFSMQGAGAQEGGEFFTPPSLVNLIVKFIQPNHGIIHDPACGSGGMFVQTAHFIEDHSKGKSVNEAITVYGTELKSNNAKLAKMNLAIHGIEGKIIEGNSFYTNPHNLTGKCDFVMANPPFNVTKVDAKNKFLAEDDRLPFGVPLTGKGTISNGNYLFAQYFYSYLNETGRAGFVMASSATDAGNAEKLIRQKLIETGHVECIVSIGNNFFYTRSLPCHLWFFNKGKKAENKNKILMIDARNTYRKVTSTINDFSEEQLEGLTALINAFRGDDLGVNADNTWFNEYFPEGAYQDVEGLCKVVEMDEIIEQDYSLTPGRYVGVSIAVDMDFDYKGRMTEIHSELATLNEEANKLMNQIQSVEL
jgi:type I restriction enzyme M protein